MTLRRTTVFAGVALIFGGLLPPIGNAQQAAEHVKAVQLIGLAGVKQDAKGMLSVVDGNLHFVHAKASSDVSATSIQDVVTGGDTEKAVGKTIGMISMAAPYGGGRFLSLFRKKIDTLTVQYRDAEAGLHGAIFSMPVGTADVIKKGIVAQGARAASTAEINVVPTPSNSSPKQAESASASQEQKRAKIKASATQVEMIQSDEIKLPAEFQVALYENLVHPLEKQQKFRHIYREGDHNAATIADLVILHSTVRGFKAGSERTRQVTTVAGATSITVHCEFTSTDGKPLLEQDVNGKVRFFGGNLKATYDFAKKAAHVVHENFSSPDGK